MSTHFVELLDGLQSRCMSMGNLAQSAVRLAAEAVIATDAALARKVLEIEETLDAEEVAIERSALSLFALHQPAATDLRTVFAVVKVNIDLERIGDCASNIAEQVTRLARSDEHANRDLRLIAETTVKQMDDTMRCLATKDPALAEEITRNDDMVDALYNQILQEMQADSAVTGAPLEPPHKRIRPADLATILIAKNFERIGDHCNNIAEDVVFLMKGHIIRHAHDQP